MKILAIALAGAFLPAAASAACYGSGSISNCYDDSGNSYTVNRMGDTTFTYGSNSRTGSSWNQTSQDMGTSTFHYGTDSNGNSWSSTCGPYGCN